MSDRAEFESTVRATWGDNYSFMRYTDGHYCDDVLDGMWWAWQVSCSESPNISDHIADSRKMVASEREARAQSEPSSGVPEGWKLVPIEPTESMITAFEHAPCAENYTDAATWSWRAMISAAPHPEAGQSDPVAYWDGDTGEAETAFQFDRDAIYKIPVYTHPHNGEQDAYPDCDTCGKSMDYMPWHYSKGEKRHLHACNECWPEVNGEQGGEWVRCDERLPTEADADWDDDVIVFDSEGDMAVTHYGVVEQCGQPGGSITHWMPTGLKRPQPPQEGSGDE